MLLFLMSALSLSARTDVDVAKGVAGNVAREIIANDARTKETPFREEKKASPVSNLSLKGSEGVNFVFRKMNVKGLKFVEKYALSKHWNSYLNKKITFNDFGNIVKKITQDLRSQGLVLAQVIVPPQNIDPKTGIVQIDIYEGTLNNIRVEGGTPESRALVESQLIDIRKGDALNLKNVEERMRFISKTPGYKIKHIFVPSKDVTGASDMVIRIETKEYGRMGGNVDNAGNRLSGHRRWGADALVNNTIGRSKLLLATIHDFSGNKFHFYRARQTQFVGNRGTRAYIEYVKSRARPWMPIKVESRFDYANLMVMHPLIYRRHRELKLRVAIDGQNDSARTAGLRTKDDYVRGLRVGLLYNQTHGNDFWELSAVYNKGFTGLLGGKNTVRPSVYGGKANFTYVDGKGSWVHKFNSIISVSNTFSWQSSRSPLLSSEEMSVGSSNFGRGYGSGEISGDSGIGGLTELRINIPYKIKYVDSLMLYTSYGVGYVKNTRVKSDSNRTASLASVAAGLRGRLAGGFNVSYEAAKPLTRKVQLDNHRGLNHTVRISYSKPFIHTYK